MAELYEIPQVRIVRREDLDPGLDLVSLEEIDRMADKIIEGDDG